MTRKLLTTIVLVLFVSLFATNPVLAIKSYYAERFDVQIEIQENGSAIIMETVKFHFEGGPFTFAFREVSATETDGLIFLDASMDGVGMPQGTQPGQVEVTAGNPLKVTWHFTPTSDAAHVFTIRYRADGVICKGDADTLIWRAIPEDHDYSIAQSTITLTYPSGATPLEQPTLSREFESSSTENRILLTQSGLAKDEDLILTASFAPNSLVQAAPQWQIQKEHADAATAKALPVGFIAGITTLIFGGLGLFTYIRSNGRDLNISPVISTPNPPADISPALIGKLTAKQHTFMGAIFDLAQRGILDVREEKGFWGMKNLILTHTDRTNSLQPYEQRLMDVLFKYGEAEINMNEVDTQLSMKNKLFDEPLEQELIQRGWAPDKLRRYDVVKNLAREMDTSNKVIGIICHGGLIAISAGIIKKSQRAIGSVGIKDDLENVGAVWADEPAFREGNQVWGRVVADIPDFNRELVKALIEI